MRLEDLTGKRFGRLVVLERAENAVAKNGVSRVMWRCKCDCGNECERSSGNLKAAVEASCGCRRSELIHKYKFEDLTGQRFGRLTVIERAPSKNITRWKCHCDCGNDIVTTANNLKRGHTTSCGCFREENRPNLKYKHGLKKSRIYEVWSKIKDRCCNEKNKSYPRYGGRGITMCDEWKNDPEAFAKWAYENGYRDDAEYGECTVDRIDNNKGYSPENCRIVDLKVQSNNRRSNLWIEHNGERKTLAQWRDFFHLTQGQAHYYFVEKKMSIQEFIDKGIA